MRYLAPGHGALIHQPVAEVEKLIAHRLGREAKVAQALAKIGVGSLDDLLPIAYDDVATSIYPMARLSLWAHMLKLKKDGRAMEQAGSWQAVTSR